MERISRQFGKEKGIQLRHFIISFDPQETTDPRVVAAIACEIIPYDLIHGIGNFVLMFILYKPIRNIMNKLPRIRESF